jgi:divalent metal cation (Fe/Co/Zn/Cd) transporter
VDGVASERSGLQRRARVLAFATVGWNAAEAGVAIAAGRRAGSLALVSSGLDSVVEVGSALVVLWQMGGVSEEREHRALRLIAISFWALAAYVSVRAVWDLSRRSRPDTSVPGIGLAAASLVVMPLLARSKKATARELGSPTVEADSNQTKLCAWLSLVLLGGLVLDAALGWWWADPVAALGIAAVAGNEGRQAWRGEECCD